MKIVQISQGPSLCFGPSAERLSVTGTPVTADHTFFGTGLWCVDSDGMVYAQVMRMWDGDTKTPFWRLVPSKVVNE